MVKNINKAEKSANIEEKNAKVEESKVFSENFNLPMASTELTHIEKDGVIVDKFQYKSTDKDGNIVLKSTNNLTTMQVVNSVKFFANVGKLSNMAISIEFGRVTSDIAKGEGYKTVSEMIKSIFPEYSNNTINQYRRVGQFFGVREIDKQNKVVYRWRVGIDASVSVTNLTQVISLANLPDNFERLTKEEKDKLYSEFYNNYIETGKINLNLPQADLKKQIKTAISDNNAIDGTFAEKKSEETNANENNSDNSDNSENIVLDTPKKTATEAIVALSLIFKENTEILTILAKVSEEIEKLPDTDATNSENTDNSNDNK